MREYLVCFLVAAAVTYLLTPPVRRLAIRAGAMAEVRDRDIHASPTPRWGGLAMYGGFLAGLVIATVCILFSALGVLLYLIAPHAAPRGTTTIIVALFFLSGIQLLFIGMLGEYITAIHNQVRGGPMVIESERLNVAADEMPLPRLTGVRG